MKKESLKKVMALGVSAAMMLGNVIPAMAANGAGTTGSISGEGQSTGHLDTSYVEASLPSDGTVQTIFKFYVDPEDIIGQGGKFATADVEAVDDLVYFAQAEAGKYGSTSQNLAITIKNYSAVDLKVTATVSAEGTMIPLVATDTIDNTKAATDAALYLTLKVGSNDPVALAAGEDGVSSVYEQAAQNGNFDITGNIEDGYEVAPKSTPASDWATVNLALAGKAQLVTNAENLVAPTVSLAYTITKHVSDAAPNLTDESTSYAINADTTTVSIGFTYGAGSLAADSLVITYSTSSGTKTLKANDEYTISNGSIVLSQAFVNSLKNISANSKVFTVTFSDGTVKTFTITK